MSEQEAAAKDNVEVKNVEKKKCDKKGKKKGKTTRVVAMASVPMVLSEDERLMAAVFRYETTQETIEVKTTETTGSGDGNGNAKPNEKEEGKIDGDEGKVKDVKGEVQGNGEAIKPETKPEGNGEAAADKPATDAAPKE